LKSRALLNLDSSKTVIVSPNNKDLPFKSGSTKYVLNTNYFKVISFEGIQKVIEGINAKMPEIKHIIIEDLTHYFSERVMRDAKMKSYDKWTDLAVDAFNALIKSTSNIREDLWIIVIAHTTTSTDVQGNQIITLQTPGKLLENAVKIPSYFTYVLHTDPVMGADGKMTYRFLTNTDGIRIAKSPEGCLDLYENNDYAVIIDKITKYQSE
jgi:hypothetical protein